jgi:ribosomal protein L37E
MDSSDEASKLSEFKRDIKNERTFSEKVKNMYQAEFDEIFEDILTLTKEDFISNLTNNVSQLLSDMYSEEAISNKNLIKIINSCESEFEEEYKYHFEILNKNWKNFERENRRGKINENSYLNNFRKHCAETDDIPYHNCQNNLSKFYQIEENGEIEYVICIACQKVYFSNMILCHCNNCNEDYYTSILGKNEDKNLLPATWKKYHCEKVINEKMKCIKCNRILYLNLQSKMLVCLNLKCNFKSKQERISWICSICNTNFRSEAIVYNPLENEHIKKIIRQTLYIKRKAHPNKLPCCKLNIFFTKFYHKSDCKGTLYFGEINNNIIVVCERCKAFNFYDRFIWTCPKCGSRFRDKKLQKDNDINKENKLNNFRIKSLEVFASPIRTQSKFDNQKKDNNFTSFWRSYNKSKDEEEENDIKEVQRDVRRRFGNDLYENNNNNNKLSYKEERERIRKEREERLERERKEREEREREREERRERREKERKEREEKLKKEKEEKEKKEEGKDRIIRRNIFDGFNRNRKTEEEEEDESPKRKNRNLRGSLKEGKRIEIEEEDNQNNRKRHLRAKTERKGNILQKEIDKFLKKSKLPKFNINDYTLYKQIGEGSYGVIYQAFNNKDRKKYGMKKIIAHDIEELEEFEEEFELVYDCNHPNVMKIYGICINILDNTTFALYVLMELALGDWNDEIKKHLDARKHYKEDELINILKQLVNPLLYLQIKMKIAHRDIKPQNILIFKNKIYKVADFGEAKEAKIAKQLNTLRGTELYMSPVLYDGLKKDKDDIIHNPYKSDVFSLGFCLMYAAFLNFNIIYEVRDVNDMNRMEKILQRHFKNKYTEKFIKLLLVMLEINESKRCDFVELNNYINENFP